MNFIGIPELLILGGLCLFTVVVPIVVIVVVVLSSKRSRDDVGTCPDCGSPIALGEPTCENCGRNLR